SSGLALVAALALVAGCSSGEGVAPDAGELRDAAVLDVGVRDGAADPDASGADAAPDASAPRDAEARDATPDDAGAFDPGPEPADVLRPIAGELTILQLDIPAGAALALGESAIIVGPDGTLVLVDVGNGSHDDDVRDVVRALNTRDLVPARGFAARSPMQVEWIVITHFHGDHFGALEDLFSGREPIELVHGLVHRGFVDLGDGANAGDFAAFCALLRGPLAQRDVPLCTSPATPSTCALDAPGAPFAADACPGLSLGDLLDPSDDGATYLPLGDGARLTLLAADGFVSDGTTSTAMTPFGHDDSNEENARSLVGLVHFGAFRYHFAGDLTGSGEPGEPDAESHVVDALGPSFHGAVGVDVVHANHHARRTSSNASFVDLLAPIDGRARNVVAGINASYVGSPHRDVVDAWTGGGRLGAGALWVTDVAAGGATGASVVDAGGAPIIVQTRSRGAGYWIQAAGAPLVSRAFASVRL
ncbi:MBL fold metallo-hydrolase, partial [Myxococcota bacterium]|nr:MBL fold metallo-hydrolase [Myxococcota bacterium]